LVDHTRIDACPCMPCLVPGVSLALFSPSSSPAFWRVHLHENFDVQGCSSVGHVNQHSGIPCINQQQARQPAHLGTHQHARQPAPLPKRALWMFTRGCRWRLERLSNSTYVQPPQIPIDLVAKRISIDTIPQSTRNPTCRFIAIHGILFGGSKRSTLLGWVQCCVLFGGL
jgi:hypothetical protein